MHMPDLSDEELDALFRQGAEDYPEELNLGAWARMEQKLDDARVQQLVNRKVARLFAAEIGIVAVLLLLWGGYREYQSSAEATATAPAEAAAPTRRITPAVGGPGARQNDQPVAAVAQTPPAATAGVAPVASAATAAAAPGTAGLASETPTAGPAVPGSIGPVARRKVRPAAAVAATHNEPGPAATNTDGRSKKTHAAASRQQQKLPLPLLVATKQAEPWAGPAGRHAAATSEAGGSARLVASRATNSVAPAGAPLNGQPTTAQPSSTAPAALPATNTPGAAADNAGTSATAPAGAAVGGTTSGAATTNGVAASGTGGDAPAGLMPPTAEAAPAAATGLLADTLQPLATGLLTGPLPELPAALPADSIVRRRPRPFVPSRLFITGLYAPEWSTVRRAGLERVGHSTGVQLEYLLRPRLRLSVALLSSMKYYRARAEDYTTPRPPMYPIERIDATCRITDIPVNLRYDAWQGVRYRAFVSAGLSSLLMRDEQYRYSYYGTNYTRTWQVRKGSRHLLSVLNLAAGLERQFTPRWSVQAEPYLKLPLGGVGAGKVRLSSGGVFFGLKYGL